MNTERAYLDRLFTDGGMVELCHMAHGRLWPTWHSNTDSLLATASRVSDTGNLFTTLNRIDCQALDEHLTGRRGHQVARTPDSCITRYCRIFFDLDPQRPIGQSSTVDELAAAQTRAMGLVRRLAALDWPTPLMAMSGNGWHVMYRTALPNNAETAEMLKAIYAGLHGEFSDDEVTFDRAVRNPARLCTLYGSMKRKGINHPERPHRLATCQVPSDWRQVHPRQVEGLANFFARRAAPIGPRPTTRPVVALPEGGRGNYATLDVVAWFAAHGRYVGPLAGHVHGVRCPWLEEHTSSSPKNGSDSVIFEGDGTGWPGFHCKHSHCQDRDIRDVMALLGDADAYCGAAFVPMRRAG